MRKDIWLRLSFLTLQVDAFVQTKRHNLKKTVAMSSSSKKETVAIIGGGISGLSCAQFLSKSSKFVPTVFDTGRLRPGGRCSSRFPKDKLFDDQSDVFQPNITVDHTAQILTVPQQKGFTEFEKQVEEWEQQGILTAYPASTVCNILDDSDNTAAENRKSKNVNAFRLQPINEENTKKTMYYGTEGMGSIPLAMCQLSDFELQQDVWVSPSNGVRYMQNQKQKWKLQAKGQVLGKFDRIIIAHNGKCADRITSKTPAKQINSLLKVNFAPKVQNWGGKKMTLNSIYSLTFSLDRENNALAQPLPKDKFVCGFIRNEPSLRFLSCHTRKYESNDIGSSSKEVWTLFSSPTFAKKYKAPQEFLPDKVVSEVTNLMMRALEKSLHLQAGSLGFGLEDKNARYSSRLQLWGAGVPLNIWRSSEDSQPTEGSSGGFLYDGDHSVGVCGDWLLDASIGGAWESGRRLAQFMISSDGSTSAGLEGKFQRSAGSHEGGLGSFVSSN